MDDAPTHFDVSRSQAPSISGPLPLSRRHFLAQFAGATLASPLAGPIAASSELLAAETARQAQVSKKARIAITFDLEMSRNFPTWETTHWDYEKGNLDDDTKRYAREAARRVKARGAKMHFFVVGRVFEQENIDWLREIVDEGHAIGNHTYDHVNVKATEPEAIQFRFQRAPWLIGGRTPREVIADNIRLTELALDERLGIKPAGFRTPGGFHNGLVDRPDVQELLLSQGYRWASSRYPAHPLGAPGERPTAEVFDRIVAAQADAQPSVYPTGLVEVPMSPISDITAFRGGRWPLQDFLTAIRLGVEWAIAEQRVFDFLGHPSALVVTDPEFKTLDLIGDLVEAAGPRAEIVDLDSIAAIVTPPNDATDKT